MKVGIKVWFISQIYTGTELRGVPYRGIISKYSCAARKIIIVDHTGQHLVTTYGEVIGINLFDLIEFKYQGWKFNNPVDMTIPTEQSMFDIMQVDQ